ncbi:unnamed protein product [Aphanomyces euteiches]
MRLMRIELHQVLDVDATLAAKCFRGFHSRASVYAKLRLCGAGASPTFQSNVITPSATWTGEIFELTLNEDDLYRRVLSVTLYGVDMWGRSVELGQAFVLLTEFELLKHHVTISKDISLTEEAATQATRCRLRVSASVWAEDDVKQSVTLELWQHERKHNGIWSTHHLIPEQDHFAYSCGSASSSSWETIEPSVPTGYVEVLGWGGDRSQGDDKGWFYATTFDSVWHNSSGGFPCRRRRLVKYVLLAAHQAQKQAYYTLMAMDHPKLIEEFQQLQLVVKGQAAELQHKQEVFDAAAASHTLEIDRIKADFQSQLNQSRADYEAQQITLKNQVKMLEAELEAVHESLATLYNNKEVIPSTPTAKSGPRMFRVQLHRSSNLVAADSALLGGKSDPYVVFDLDGVKHTSSMIKNCLNPEWEFEIYEFQLLNLGDKLQLHVHVFDHDQWSDDDLIGSLTLSISEAMQQTSPQWFRLSIPAEFASQKCDSKIQLAFECIDCDDSVELVMWENQRRGKQWSPNNLLPSERRGWSVGSASSAHRQEICPSVPAQMESRLGWAIDRSHGDAQGSIIQNDILYPDPVAIQYKYQENDVARSRGKNNRLQNPLQRHKHLKLDLGVATVHRDGTILRNPEMETPTK